MSSHVSIKTDGRKRKRTTPATASALPMNGQKKSTQREGQRSRKKSLQTNDQNPTNASYQQSDTVLRPFELPAIEALATGFRLPPHAVMNVPQPVSRQNQHYNQAFTEYWSNQQELGDSYQDLHTPLAYSWEKAPQLCGPSLPCENPNCEDVSPCPSATGGCADPEDCVGNICYDQHCFSNGKRTDLWCDQHCEEATRCVSPCFSDECKEPACDAPCVAAPGHEHTRQTDHERRGSEVLCHSQECDIPGFECIDPQCLFPGYAPATHVHHPMHQWYNYGQGNFDFATGLPKANVQDYHAQHQSYNNPMSAAPVTTSFNTSLQPLANHNDYDHFRALLDFNQAPPATQLTLETATPSNANFPPPPPPLPPPDLSHSLTSTPKSSTSPPQDFAGFSLSLSPSRTDQPHVCLWSADADGAPTQPCGQIFNDAADLHAHVERSHIDTLQRTSTPALDTSTNGYHCRWAGCARNTLDPNSGSSPGTVSPTTTTPTSFAARPKLKRHLQTHTHHTPYHCPHCPSVMKTKDAMSKHLRTHTGERPYACPLPSCTKIFATSTELKTHMVVHSGLKPHVCSVCGEGFADSSNLSKHRKVHLRVGMWRCLEEEGGCGVRMKRWDQMRRHWVGRGHCGHVLGDEERLRVYKEGMEREFRGLLGLGLGGDEEGSWRR